MLLRIVADHLDGLVIGSCGYEITQRTPRYTVDWSLVVFVLLVHNLSPFCNMVIPVTYTVSTFNIPRLILFGAFITQYMYCVFRFEAKYQSSLYYHKVRFNWQRGVVPIKQIFLWQSNQLYTSLNPKTLCSYPNICSPNKTTELFSFPNKFTWTCHQMKAHTLDWTGQGRNTHVTPWNWIQQHTAHPTGER